MSFFILRLLAILIKRCYRLSRALNPNPRPIFLAEISFVRNRPISNEFFYFKTFGRFDQTVLYVIEGLESESEAHFLAEISLVGSQPIRNELSYFKTFGRSD